MAEYIERDKLGADFELCNKQNPRWTPQRVASLIARANAADVVEVVHGRWEFVGKRYARCTHCGSLFDIVTNRDLFRLRNKFCLRCGARMDGDNP